MRPWLEWYETIPAEIRDLLAPFRKRKWHMLSLMAYCGKPAVDLVVSNPAIAYALASNWVFHTPQVKQPMRSSRGLLKPGKKQHEILSWLGFPGTEGARKLCAKLSAKDVSITNLLSLRQSMQNTETYTLLSHISEIDGNILQEKRVGQYSFHPETVVMAAGNLEDDNAIVTPLSSALCNRFAHYEMRPDLESWLSWAGMNGINEHIMAFI